MDLSIEPDFDPDDYEDPEPRRGRGFLATDVNIACREFTQGEYVLPEGKFLTPYIIAKIIKEKDGLDKMPSSGAITKIFKQWEEWGYATFRSNPFAFIDFTEIGKTKTLMQITREQRDLSRGR
jgi:hypothetical protein